MVRGSLGLPPFEPSLVFASAFPDYYTEEFQALWREGFKIPEISQDDQRTYNIAMEVYAEMQAEAVAAAEAARVAAGGEPNPIPAPATAAE
jgi:hypothetical protein